MSSVLEDRFNISSIINEYAKIEFVKTFVILPLPQIHENFMYIERLPTIAELVISSFPTISQQFLGFKKLSFVGDLQL